MTITQSNFRALILALAIFATIGVAGMIAADSSKASWAYFCGGSSSSGGAPTNTLPPNGSCTGIGNSTLTMVAVTTYGGELHCAVGKQGSTGGGSNVIPAACGTNNLQQTPCVSPRSGYPKATNGTGSTIIFSGKKWYNSCS